MSHWTTIKVEIKCLESLAKACLELGVDLLAGGAGVAARGYAGILKQAPFVIKLKGPYDIAVEPAGDGSYTLSTDWWDGHVAKEVGVNFGRLLQAYGVARTERMARQRGLRVNKQQRADGSIVMTLSSTAL
jgi:hypothetical protein